MAPDFSKVAGPILFLLLIKAVDTLLRPRVLGGVGCKRVV